MTEKLFDIFATIIILALMIIFTIASFTEWVSLSLSLRLIGCVIVDGIGMFILLVILTDKK
jgi:putative effector of murein hydrolase LrgA (UPF0299 family)